VSAIVDRLEGIAGVLEVGPGPGVLTSPITRAGIEVVAVEIDPIALSALSETAPAATVVRGDALESDLGALLDRLPTPRAVVSNMPYNITGPLLTKFAACRDRYARAVLMMQREVGTRIVARVGTAEYGSLSVFLQSQFRIAKVVDVPPSAFFPPPKVSSVVLELTSLANHPTDAFFGLVRAGFAQPRKTLANNLLAFGLDRERIAGLLSDCGLPSTVRPHQVDLATWQRMSEYLESDGRR
jgi:16S rRNA (adenine1518-N6/adenine1519-N6)-dimethyltransferase